MEQSFGAKVRHHREGKGLSKRGLAQSIGISPTYLDKVENNKSVPTIDIAGRLATALEIPLDDVFGEIMTMGEMDKGIGEIIGKLNVNPIDLGGFDYNQKKMILEMLREIEQKLLPKT